MRILCPQNIDMLRSWAEIFINPTHVFIDAWHKQRGYTALLILLALEFLLQRPFDLLIAFTRLRHDIWGSLHALTSGYLNHAIIPALGTFVIGIVLHYVRRFKNVLPLSLESTVAVIAWSYSPHVLGVAVLTFFAPLIHLNDKLFLLIPYGFVLPLLLYASFLLITNRLEVTVLTNQSQNKNVRLRISQGVILGIVTLALAQTIHLSHKKWQVEKPVMVGDTLSHIMVSQLTNSDQVLVPLAGKVTLIDFWATWCPPCVEALPVFRQLHEDFLGQPVQLLSVNVEYDNLESVRNFVKQHQLDFVKFYDQGSLQRQFHVLSLPQVFLLDKNGRVKKIFTGSVKKDALTAAISELL